MQSVEQSQTRITPLRARREELGLTRSEVGRLAGCSRQSVRRAEEVDDPTGRESFPQIVLALAGAAYLNGRDPLAEIVAGLVEALTEFAGSEAVSDA
jgi:DNA-binding XRE family transcriptional regulator